MDKALKQRLVGASVLIALAVIVLPMLLGGPTESGQQQSQRIELPTSPEGVEFETRRFPLTEGPGIPSVRSSTSQLPGSSEASGAEEPLKSVAGVSQPEEQMPESSDSGLVDIESQPAIEPQNTDQRLEGPPPVATVEIPVTEKVDLPVVAELAKSETGIGTKAQVSHAAGRYAVQVASLSSEANAKRLQSNLESMAYPVIADRIESDVGRLFRIRVGPFDTEAEANAAGKKIQSQLEGVNPRTVDLTPAAATQVITPSDPLVRWVVQLGSFGEASNADNLVKQVRAQGLSAYSERVSSSAGAVINRVRVGPFLQREDAGKAQQQLSSSLGVNGVVMSAE